MVACVRQGVDSDIGMHRRDPCQCDTDESAPTLGDDYYDINEIADAARCG